MILKKSNFIFRQFKQKIFPLKYCFSITSGSKQSSNNLQDKQENQFKRILSLAIEDEKNKKFKNYKYVKAFLEKQFSSYPNVFTLNKLQSRQVQSIWKQQTKLLLKTVGEYPLIQLSNQSINGFYKNIVNRNIHNVRQQILEKYLILALLIDPHIMKSTLYAQYAKFYLKNNFEILRALFSINLEKQSIINSLKLILIRIYQRGFLARKPSYYRSLEISQHVKLLELIIGNSQLHSSLMIKKINYQYFRSIKTFYQSEMKQNLYHQKNILLLSQKLIPILPVMVKSWQFKIETIQNQMKFLRQLYIKLFLVMQRPSIKNSIYWYDIVQNKYLSQGSAQVLFKGQNIHEIQSNNFKQQKQILFQFLKKVSSQFQLRFKDINSANDKEKLDKQNMFIKQFDFQEILLILKNSVYLKLDCKMIQIISNQMAQRMSPILLKRHLKRTLQLCRNEQIYQNISQSFLLPLIKIFSDSTIYEQLSLDEIAKFSELDLVKRQNQIKKALLNVVLKKDINNLDSIEILNLLKIYLNTNISQETKSDSSNKGSTNIGLNDHLKNGQILICFILRFLSDHHQQLFKGNDQLQQILNMLFFQPKIDDTPSLIGHPLIFKNFNDSQNNYPNLILDELKAYIDNSMWKIKDNQLRLKLEKYYNQ